MTAADGELRYGTEYHSMTSAEKDMYNKIIVAQYKMKHEEMSKKVDEMKKK